MATASFVDQASNGIVAARWNYYHPVNISTVATLHNMKNIIQKRSSGLTTDQELFNKTLPVLIVSSILALINIIVNTSVLILMLTRRKLRTVANAIMASMFFSHLCYSCLYTIPYVIYRGIDISSHIQLSQSSTAYCLFMLFVLPNTMAVLMNLHICAIAVTQFISVSAPFFYQNVMLNRKAIIFIIVGLLWILSFIIGFMPFIIGLYNWEFKFCVPDVNEDNVKLLIPWNIFITVFRFAFPFILILLFYWRIYLIARQKSEDSNIYFTEGTGQRVNACKAAKVIAVIIGVYVICKLPRDATNLIRITSIHIADPDLFSQFHYWSEFIGIYASSIINPILYTYLNRAFRNEVTLLIKRYKRNRNNRYLFQKDKSSNQKSKSQFSRDLDHNHHNNRVSNTEFISNQCKTSKANSTPRQASNESSVGSNIHTPPLVDPSNPYPDRFCINSPMIPMKCSDTNAFYFDRQDDDDDCNLLRSSFETVV